MEASHDQDAALFANVRRLAALFDEATKTLDRDGIVPDGIDRADLLNLAASARNLMDGLERAPAYVYVLADGFDRSTAIPCASLAAAGRLILADRAEASGVEPGVYGGNVPWRQERGQIVRYEALTSYSEKAAFEGVARSTAFRLAGASRAEADAFEKAYPWQSSGKAVPANPGLLRRILRRVA